MGVVHPYPLGFGNLFVFSDLKHDFCFAHHCMAEVNGISDDSPNYSMRPLIFLYRILKAFVIMLFPTLMEPPRWTGHLLLAKQRDDFVWPHPGVSILEYPLDDPGRFFIHNQLIVVLRGLAVADGIKG